MASPLESHPDVQALLRDARPRARRPLGRRERMAEGATALALVAAVAGLAAAAPDSASGLGLGAAVLVAVYAVAQRVVFSIGAGMTSPTQLVLVPLFLLTPPALVPLLVALGLVLSQLPECLARRVHPDRLLLQIGNAWFAVGPALVLTVADPGPPSFHLVPVYAAALLAQFVVDAGASVLRERLSSGVAPALQLKLLGLVFGIDLALAPAGLLVAGAGPQTPYSILLTIPLVAVLGFMAREREFRIEQAIALSDAYRGTALLMGEMLEADDPYTGGEHSQGVVALALAVGAELRMDAQEQRTLEFGALLHDIGKLRTPNEIINKPGALTDDEWAIIRRHPADGQAMLDRIGGVLAEVGVVVRAHHERWDGGGYPDGLAGEAIPLAARIICACDSFSAMTTTRSYRAGMPVEDALAELRRCAGTQFDPAVVDAIVAVVGRDMPKRMAELVAA
ncbi:MAG TPA: HD-GYP domain-containing protein [Solirubrobacteraceae bacterium]|nr:HD-GYP domain-containing protein [Solirubrobacteraceae bacterium]